MHHFVIYYLAIIDILHKWNLFQIVIIHTIENITSIIFLNNEYKSENITFLGAVQFFCMKMWIYCLAVYYSHLQMPLFRVNMADFN